MATELIEAEGKLVLFKLLEKHYAFEVEYVVSIERLTPITRVPNVPIYFKGVINLRGVIIPIIDLSKRLSLGEIEVTEQTRIIIIDKDDMIIGLIVDEALDVIDVSEGQIEEPIEVAGAITESFIKGIIRRNQDLIMLLEINNVLGRGNA